MARPRKRPKVTVEDTKALAKRADDIFSPELALHYRSSTQMQKEYFCALAMTGGNKREAYPRVKGRKGESLKSMTVWTWRSKIPGFAELESFVVDNPGLIALDTLAALAPTAATVLGQGLSSDKSHERVKSADLVLKHLGMMAKRDQPSIIVQVTGVPESWAATKLLGEVIEGESRVVE